MKKMARLSRLAILSLILGILSLALFILIPITIVTGFIALYVIKRSRGSLKGVPFALGGMIITFVALIITGRAILNYELPYRLFKVPAASMSPTIKPKERVVADLTAYKGRDPARGDIVIYEIIDKGKRRLMCKRIAGLPGEEVEIRSGGLFVNGAPVRIPGLPDGTVISNAGDYGKEGVSFGIPNGSYYLLGDNPSASFDSRQHGPVDKKDIKGKYVFVYKGLAGILK
ncbi:MAG: signal peptidase I [Candidatus Omnitrophica bacterium]|nr:signal peptidase I [Candidatus Omnitrophota bacterium]MDD5437401.1 signal peptidase I [Candidatus Omnitrophota bacterium]